MKDKILIFVIGLLVGAVITAAGFLIYQKLNTNNNNNNMQMPNGRMEMMGERPELPQDFNNNNNFKK